MAPRVASFETLRVAYGSGGRGEVMTVTMQVSD